MRAMLERLLLVFAGAMIGSTSAMAQDACPGAALDAQLIAEPGQFLLPLQQILARGEPLITRNDFVV